MNKLIGKYLPLAYGAYFNTISSILSGEYTAGKAFQVLSKPRKGKVLPNQESYLTAAKKEKLQVGNIELQTYEWRGDKETVLLLHGWESNSFRWQNLIDTLQKEGFNIIAFDAPAHGNSTGKILHVPMFTECTQKVITRYRPKYIIGHSMGGMTALYSQYKYPHSPIEKIVAIGAPSNLHGIMKQYQGKLHLNKKIMLGIDLYFVDTFGFSTKEFSLVRFASHLPQQGLLIHDVLDTITPFQGSVEIHKKWPNSKLVKTEGLGHSMHHSLVNDQIMGFLKG